MRAIIGNRTKGEASGSQSTGPSPSLAQIVSSSKSPTAATLEHSSTPRHTRSHAKATSLQKRRTLKSVRTAATSRTPPAKLILHCRACRCRCCQDQRHSSLLTQRVSHRSPSPPHRFTGGWVLRRSPPPLLLLLHHQPRSFLAPGYSPSTPFKTGTLPFIAIEVLKNSTVTDCARFDVESLFYVAYYHFHGGLHPAQNLRSWFQYSRHDVRLANWASSTTNCLEKGCFRSTAISPRPSTRFAFTCKPFPDTSSRTVKLLKIWPRSMGCSMPLSSSSFSTNL